MNRYTMGFYDRSRSIRHPSGRPLGSRTSPNEEEIGSSLRFLGHPCGACPGLETPASRHDLANSGRCRILPSANLDNVGLATMDNFGADPSRPAALLSTLRTHRSPGEWQDSLLTCLLDFSQVGLAPLLVSANTIFRGLVIEVAAISLCSGLTVCLPPRSFLPLQVRHPPRSGWLDER